MNEKRQKIPLLLKLKRAKNSPFINKLNDLLSKLKPRKSYKGIPQRILLIRNDRIGDAVVTLPVIESIKLNYPVMKVDVLASSKNKFVFEKSGYIDDIIVWNWRAYKLAVFKQFFTPEFKHLRKFLKHREYDAVIDLVGLKRNIILGKHLSEFTMGPRKLGVYVLYDYYGDSNWVTLSDEVNMTSKVEAVIKAALNLTFEKKPLPAEIIIRESYEYDVIIHLGSTPLRKLPPEKEDALIGLFKEDKVLITDATDTDNYRKLKAQYNKNNIEFRLFNSLDELAEECMKARVLICYDGGQAHYLSRFVKTVTIFGPGSVALWKPYDPAGYTLLEENSTGVKALISGGSHRHIAIYYPIWCRPCFDVGCESVLCLSMINPDFIHYIVKKYALDA